MFTTEQFWSLVRTILQMAGAALVTRGYLDDGNMQLLIGALMTIFTTGYSLYIRRQNGLIATAAAVLPDGGKIVTTPEIAAAIPDPKVTSR